MKYLILFLICFSANANYVKLSEVESNSITKVFVKSKRCGSGCIKLPKGYDKSFHILADIMKNDVTSPVYSKSETETCIDEDDCNTKNGSKVCTDEDETVKMAQDFSDIYCTKFLRYNQIASGSKKLVIDETKKATKKAEKAAKKAAKAAKKAEVLDTLLSKLKNGEDLSKAQLRKVLLYLLGN